MSPSSTSSSRRWPWAALLAAALLFAADAALLGPRGAWQWLAARDPEQRALLQRELQRVRETPPGVPRAFVVGTSRVQQGFDAELASRELPGVAIGKLGQPRIEPFVIRQLADDLVAARADAVAILLSGSYAPPAGSADSGPAWRASRARRSAARDRAALRDRAAHRAVSPARRFGVGAIATG